MSSSCPTWCTRSGDVAEDGSETKKVSKMFAYERFLKENLRIVFTFVDMNVTCEDGRSILRHKSTRLNVSASAVLGFVACRRRWRHNYQRTIAHLKHLVAVKSKPYLPCKEGISPLLHSLFDLIQRLTQFCQNFDRGRTFLPVVINFFEYAHGLRLESIVVLLHPSQLVFTALARTREIKLWGVDQFWVQLWDWNLDRKEQHNCFKPQHYFHKLVPSKSAKNEQNQEFAQHFELTLISNQKCTLFQV